MITIAKNRFYTGNTTSLFSAEVAKHVRQFHTRIENYQPTPLVSLSTLAKKLGVKAIVIKDESHRFGLKAYKALGASYALGQILADRLNIDIRDLDINTVAAKFDTPLTFITATAGNHGIGVAWAAQKMGQKAIIYMPQGTPTANIDRVRQLGAECIVTNGNYDDTVRLANNIAQNNHWILIQDTAWEGYHDIPTWICQGYLTMADEAVEQMALLDLDTPTHVMLQAGVGSMAGSMLEYLVSKLGPESFQSIITEPSVANCIFRSGTSAHGDRVNVSENIDTIMTGMACEVPRVLDTIMTGLACGETNPDTWPILKQCSNYFAHADDSVSAVGMRVLGNPLIGDTQVISGASGAITLGVLYQLCQDSRYLDSREQLRLNQDAVILLFNTEGDTNPSGYRDIVWNGS